MKFWDASAIIPLCLDEPRSPLLRKVARDDHSILALVGNCRFVSDHVFIERLGAPNPRVERRPLRSIFAARASRVLRVRG